MADNVVPFFKPNYAHIFLQNTYIMGLKEGLINLSIKHNLTYAKLEATNQRNIF